MQDAKAGDGVPGLLAAYEVDPEGRARRLTAGEAAAPAAAGWRWLHLDGASSEAAAWLRGPAGLPGRAAEAMLAEDTRPRSAAFGEGRLVILRGVQPRPQDDAPDMVGVRIWTEGDRVISLTLRRMEALEEFFEEAEAGQGPATPGRFLTLLAERLAEDAEPVIDVLEERMAQLEDQALILPGSGVPPPEPEALSDELGALRRIFIPMRRHIAPQREALAELRRAWPGLADDADHEALTETADRLQRHVEDLDALRERASALSEQIASDAAERMNRAMYLLSVVSVLFLPLGFLTGLLGVNLGGIPGADQSVGFWTFVGLLGAVLLLEIWLIRRLRLL